MARGRGRAGRRGVRGRGRPRGGNSVKGFLGLHTGRQAGAIANAEAGAEYNPEIRNLRQEAKGSRARQRDLGKWYAQLAADYGQAQRAGSAALKSVEDTTTRQLAEAGQRESADASRLASQDEALSKLLGAPRDTAGLAKIAQAGAAAQRARAEQATLPAAEQANFVASLGSRKTAARMQGIESRQAEARRRDLLKSDLAGVQHDKGAARVAGKEKIRESDRARQSELAARRLARREAAAAERQAAAEAALAQVEADQKAREDAIASRQAQERIGISRRSAKTSERAQRATARHYRQERGTGGLSTAERRERGEHSADAMSAAKALLGVKVPSNARQWAQFEEALVEKLGSSYAAEASRAVTELRKKQAAKRRAAYGRRHLKMIPPVR